MDNTKLVRINELARMAKTRGLTEAELSERETLRREYLAEFRAAAERQLDNTYIERPDGTREKLRKRERN